MTRSSPILKVIRAKEILADPFRNQKELTPREREIAQLAARGWSITEIGQELEIVPHTVAVFLNRIRLKIGVNRHGLTRQMIERLEEALK